LYKDKKKLFSRGGGREAATDLQIKRKLEINAADAQILRQLKRSPDCLQNYLQFFGVYF
jgi:hypothetical protein